MDFLVYFVGDSLKELIGFSYEAAEWWAPPALALIFFYVWLYYIRAQFLAKQKRILLEIKVPKETYKSPLAMELALIAGFYHTSREGDWWARYVVGKTRIYSSLEMVSLAGSVKFFVWIEENVRPIVEAQLYAQYPGIEIHEAEDYTKRVPYGQEGSDWNMWGCEFVLTKDDPYPIKTYVDYGLDKDPKEEFKIDPLTPTIEFLGSLKTDEQFWLQILVRATKNNNLVPGGLFGKAYDWKKAGQDIIKEKKEEIAASNSGKDDEGKTIFKFTPMTKGETDVIAAIERSIEKPGFDVGIRAIYLAKGSAFRPANISALTGTFKQYNSNTLNGFRPDRVTDFDFPWEDPFKTKLPVKKAKMFNAYVRRSYFWPPYKRKPIVLNSEELATIYHFPGKVSETPTFERIPSKKTEPPTDLPR